MTKRSYTGVAACVAGISVLVAAALLPTYVRGSVVGLPDDLDQTTVVVGKGELIDRSSFRSATPVQTSKDVPVSITSRLTAESSSDSVVVVHGNLVGARADATGDAAVFINSSDVVSVDRQEFLVNGTPVPTWTAPPAPVVEEPARIGTLFTFAPGVEKTDHQVYEVMAHAPVTARYVDDDRTIDGMQLYHFRSELKPVDMTQTAGVTQQTQLTLPAFKWGLPGGMEMVTMNQFYGNARDMWVEPTTGATVDLQSRPQIYYAQTADDPHKVVAFSGELQYDEATKASMLADVKDGRDMIRGLFLWLPIGLAVLGLLLVGTSVIIAVRGRARRRSGVAVNSTVSTETPDVKVG
ncbi:porin PorA family protein [Nocardia sp. NPDC055165]